MKDKIRILWISAQPAGEIIKKLSGNNSAVSGGWIGGALEEIQKHEDIEMTYCFPYEVLMEDGIGGVHFVTIPGLIGVNDQDGIITERFREILLNTKPDVIQIFGTEMSFLRRMAFLCVEEGLRDRTVVWIQGSKGICAERNTDGLSISEIRKKPLYEYFAGMSFERFRRSMQKEGKEEERLIKKLRQVFVRTDWDESWCRSINPNIRLLRCNETLRSVFYSSDPWDISAIERHSIFISQYYAALKGFHKILDAVGILIGKYPDIRLYVTGNDLYAKRRGIKGKLKKSSYEEILKKRIEKYGIRDNVIFLGKLSASKMCERYRKSNVFVSASSIENSPNSVGEAMMIGVPVIASFVGGVASMLEHKKEGLLYPYNETAMLAYYISFIFDNDKYAMKLSKAGRERAFRNHNRETNYQALLEGYKKIIGEN